DLVDERRFVKRQIQEHFVGEYGNVIFAAHKGACVILVITAAPDDPHPEALSVELRKLVELLVHECPVREKKNRFPAFDDCPCRGEFSDKGFPGAGWRNDQK